ncbi:MULTISPECIES: hypothetical protein [Streptomyces]|uniref:hypothetical protein n=1 Tax=Streptomyces TaxID=1883 RepID=UPI001671D818|nr:MULTISPECIES: hypothetical protein [Streptomyces]MBK3522961.1 hypothetical protein [Streptomyces sp. MBT70]GGR76884.1 hypothetical protein GCM10010236_34430 [Streptomyces eurythermus]
MDLDSVADELYGLRPEEFVAARDRRARDAREAGEQALAKEIGALRRPSLAAWAGNLLVRRRPEEVEPLLGLGEELRRAHRELDGTRLRELARRQGEVIGALGRQARRLAEREGHPVGESVQREVEETLHAVLADPEAARAWAAGRLVKPLRSTFGFPQADVLEPRPSGGPRRAADGRREKGGHREERGEPRREKPGDTAVEPHGDELARRRRIKEARRAAHDAEGDLRDREAEARSADADAETAGDRVAETERRVRELRAELRRAERERQQARTDERTARERARRAGRAVREARHRAGTAAERVERLVAGERD